MSDIVQGRVDPSQQPDCFEFEPVSELLTEVSLKAGFSFRSSEIPNAYVETATPSGTTSATLVDVPNMSLTLVLTEAVNIVAISSFEIATQSGAAPSTIAIAVNIDGTDHDPVSRYLSGTSDVGIGALVHRTAIAVAAGSHTVKLRYKRVSGAATPGINRADLFVMALQGATGATGPAGPTGATGAASTVPGPRGLTGPAGEVPEAPVDGKMYVRKDAAWVELPT